MTPAKQKTLVESPLKLVAIVLTICGLILSVHFHLAAKGMFQSATDSKQDTKIEHNAEGVDKNYKTHREDLKEIRVMHKEILERLPRK